MTTFNDDEMKTMLQNFRPPDVVLATPPGPGSVMPVASCAHRIFMSPHEWTWTQSEQEEMAREIIRMDDAIKLAAPLLREIHKHPARNGPIQVAAAKLMAALGISQNTDSATSG